MDGIPSYGGDSASNGSPKKFQLNNEEIHHLLTKISSDEQQELTGIMRSCTSEVYCFSLFSSIVQFLVLWSRGLPISGAILGSLYLARTRLPAQYHFGPKGWPFYAIMGIGSLTMVNVFSMGTCRDRVQPKIEALWKKYQQPNGNQKTYDEIRRQHRGDASPYSNRLPTATVDQPDTSRFDSYPSTDLHSLEQPSDRHVGSRSSPPQFIYDEPAYMSGTPLSSTGAPPPKYDFR